MHKVSIVIPTYNRADLLPYTLDSLLAQTYDNWEAIVMDNASVDSTPALLASYQSRDPRFRVFRNPVNVGMVPNYNLGLQQATGHSVAFLDSDDTFEPTKLEKQVQHLNAHPEVDLVYTRFYNMDQGGRRLNQSWVLPVDDLYPLLMVRYFAVFGSLLIRMPFMQKMGGFDPSISMTADWDFYLRSALAGARFGCVQEVLTSYRLHPNNATRNALAEETALHQILDRALADPRMPADVRALETQSRVSICLWLAYGCCASSQWDDMQRQLREVWRLKPALLEDLTPMLLDIREMALSVRVQDPLEFLDRMLAHWPEEAALTPAQQTRLRSMVHLGYGLRLYSFSRIADAQREIKAALVMNPPLLHETETLERLMFDQAITAVVNSPLDYLNCVFGSLPAEARAWQTYQKGFTSRMRAVCAFGSYQSHRYKETRAHVLAALVGQPSLAKNRGMLSILAKSLTMG